jgi:uncharacterized protein YecE (DUF72 family)
MAAFLVGTSGYAFKEWKGPFYPPKHPDAELLPFYARHFPAVEINNTFYRMPREKTLLDWAAQVPPHFRFALKASQRITHHARLKDAGELVAYLAATSAVLGHRLGPTLFQLPPNLKQDLPRLRDFLAVLPKRWRVTVEFRHPSWFDDATWEALRERGVALCVSDQDGLETPLVATAPWGYARLHRLEYDAAALDRWAERLRGAGWDEAFVFFKHDHGPASGPPVALALQERLGDAPPAPGPAAAP